MKLSLELRQRVMELLIQGRKFEAVKLIYQETGSSLKESKEAVDAIDYEVHTQ